MPIATDGPIPPVGDSITVAFVHLLLFRFGSTLSTTTMSCVSLQPGGSSLRSNNAATRAGNAGELQSQATTLDTGVDARMRELLDHLPAPWKEERNEQGISASGHRSLTELLSAPVPKQAENSNRASTSGSTKPQNILPDKLSGCHPAGKYGGCRRDATLTLLGRALRACHYAPCAEGTAGLYVRAHARGG